MFSFKRHQIKAPIKAFCKNLGKAYTSGNALTREQIVNSAAKGQTVLLESPIQRGELVCEYSGELITYNEGLKRENFCILLPLCS